MGNMTELEKQEYKRRIKENLERRELEEEAIREYNMERKEREHQKILDQMKKLTIPSNPYTIRPYPYPYDIWY